MKSFFNRRPVLYHALIWLIGVYFFSLHAQTPIDFNKIDVSRINSDPAVTWQQFGPGGSGNNYYLFWHPTLPNIVFQGPNMFNAYRSTDKGITYQGILDYDAPGYTSGERGPIEINTPDFSHQNPGFGFCTRELESQIYQTTDTGATWSRRRDIEAVIAGQFINTITVDPTDDNIWYMGTGSVSDANRFLFSNAKPHGYNNSISNHIAKIWKTTNKGASWQVVTPAGLNTDAQITRIMVHPGKPNTVFAATTYGFFKSEDGGITWTAKNTGLDNSIIRSFDMFYNKTTNKVSLYVIDLIKYIPGTNTVSYNGGVFSSANEGDSWQNITNNMPLESSLLNSYAIKSSYYDIALSGWFDITGAVARTTYPTLPTKLLHSVSVIRVNPVDSTNILVLNNYKSQFTFKGGMMWGTKNGGKKWYVTFRNGTKWEGSDKSLWVARGNPTSHNITFRAQHEWENRDPYDQKAGATVEFNSDGKTIMYQCAKVVCISENGGDSWVENDEIDASPNNEHWVGAGNSNMPGRDIITDPRFNHVYFCSGENSIWKTTTDGSNVRPGAQAVYKMNIPNKANPEECSVASMVIDPYNVNVMYSVQFRQAFSGMLMKSVDGGANWVQYGKVLDFPTNLSLSKANINQSSLIIDPDDVKKFYLCVPSRSIDDVTQNDIGNAVDPCGAYQSVDSGRTFQKINSGFTVVPNNKLNVQKLRFDPNDPGVVFAAVSGQAGGLYKLAKNSTTWVKVNTPPGVTDVNDLFFTNDKLFITCGAGYNTNASNGGVWVTTNRGTSWNQIFKSFWANHIRVASYNANVIMTDIPSSKMINPGIYRSLDGGSTWSKINVGNLQSDRIADLEIDEHQRGLYWCTTYGAGLYKGTDPVLMKDDGITPARGTYQSVSLFIYPNPVKNQLRFKLVSENKIHGTVSIHSILGAVVLSKSIDGENTVDVSELPEGAYILSLKTNNQVFSQKFIKGN